MTDPYISNAVLEFICRDCGHYYEVPARRTQDSFDEPGGIEPLDSTDCPECGSSNVKEVD